MSYYKPIKEILGTNLRRKSITILSIKIYKVLSLKKYSLPDQLQGVSERPNRNQDMDSSFLKKIVTISILILIISNKIYQYLELNKMHKHVLLLPLYIPLKKVGKVQPLNLGFD